MTSAMKTNLPKPYIFLLLAFATVFLTGCRGWRLVRSEETRNTDSVIVRTEYVERFDTAYIIITEESQQVLADTSSVLENDYCISEAKITPDGLLFHSLETKPQQKPVPFKTTEKKTDSIIYRYRYRLIKDPVPVQREFTKWELVRLHGFWYMLAVLVLSLVWMCRKPLIKLFLRIVRA